MKIDLFFLNLYKSCYRLIDLDLQGKLYTVMEICRLFDGTYKEHLDGVYVSTTIIFYNIGQCLGGAWLLSVTLLI